MEPTDFRLQIPVPQPPASYGVRVACGALADVPAVVRQSARAATRVAIVSDSEVMPLHGERVRAALVAAGFTVGVHVVPAGEGSKSIDELTVALDALLALGLGRGDAVVALGGGVVGDLAGLVAHLLLRGVAVIQCPSSLVAQVDASVGGKVAIDRPLGKNLVGAFHPPAAVLVDPELLRTLPTRHLRAGAAEMIKHALLFDDEHLAALVDAAAGIVAGDPEVCAPLVATSIALKAACVAADPFERTADGGRMLLNLGHTIGHALEAASGYTMIHGEAVGLGLCAAAQVSIARVGAPPALLGRVRAALDRFGLPSDFDRVWSGELRARAVAALAHDKKRSAAQLSYIALAEVARPVVVRLAPAELVAILDAAHGVAP